MAESLRSIFTFPRRHQFLKPIIFRDSYDPGSVKLLNDLVVLTRFRGSAALPALIHRIDPPRN